MVHAAKEHIIKVLETIAGCTVQNHLSQFQLAHIFEFLESQCVAGSALIADTDSTKPRVGSFIIFASRKPRNLQFLGGIDAAFCCY